MSNPTEARCPRCAAPLPPSAPEGLCPRCLGALNLVTDTVLTGADAIAAQPPLTPAELAPHFPQLEILECLGRGGMGVVYRVRQKALNRLAALKLLAPERVTDAGFAERFTREAQALARLNHPNIVTIYDFGFARAGDLQSPSQTPPTPPSGDYKSPAPPPSTLDPQPSTASNGFYFLLMEFMDGVNLRQAMKAGRFTPEQALAIVPPVCEALQYAHEQGIVHRDIKPENLLLDKAGRLKIADFGIAKLVARHSDVEMDALEPSDAAELSQPLDSTLESRATTAGTPGYMAPEQKSAPQRVDSRADIYSLGVVLYELLTGELPGAKLQPPSRKVQIDVRLDEVVLRALETKPELRFQTAGEFRTQIETFTGSAPPAAAVGQAQLGEPAWFKPVGLLYALAGLLGWLPTVASLGTHIVVEHIEVMLAATGLALLTRHPWWRRLALGCNGLAVAFIVFIQLRAFGAPGPADVRDAATELAGRVPELLLLLISFSVGIWLLRRADTREVFARPPANVREHRVFGALAVLALLGGLLTAPPFGGVGISPVILGLKAAGVLGLAAWCLLRGGTTAALFHPARASGVQLWVLTAAVAFGLALVVGFVVMVTVYRARDASMAERDARAAELRASSKTTSPQSPAPAPELAFGPVIERVITFNETGSNGLMFVNLEKAELLPPPFPLPMNSPDPGIFQRSARIEEWIAASGADLALHLTDHNWGFTSLGTRLIYHKDEPDHATFLERVTLKEAQAILAVPKGQTNYLSSLGGRVSAYPVTASYVFKTRQGTIGLLQMTGFADGFTDNPRGVKLRFRLGLTNAPAAAASPITSSIAASDNSPEAIAAAQQRGIANATRDIQAGVLRILRYGLLVKTDGTETDEETGFRVQWVAGSILSSQFQAEADAYNFAMREHWQKHVRWERKAATNAPPPMTGRKF